MDIKVEVIILLILLDSPKIVVIIVFFSIIAMYYFIFPTRKETVKKPLSLIDRPVSNTPIDRTFCDV